MLIKAFPHGKGGGSAPVEYLLRLDYHGRKENPPEVLRGDPLVTRELIDSIGREWKFTSGVYSWSGEDEVTPDQIEEAMDKFEEVAFAGLEPDQYNILWVHHSHVNRCELHFVIPRMELSTGNAFNAFPPGWQKDFDPLRDYENIKHNWTRPDDPERARMFTPSNADIIEARLSRWGQNPTKQEKEKARDVINNYIRNQIENGIITNRSDITTSLKEVGLEINRESKNFITVKDSETNEKIRLNGGVYNAGWRAEISSRETQSEGRRGTPASREDCRRELSELEQKITGIIQKRADYNRERYQDKSRDSELKSEQTLQDFKHSLRQGVGTFNNINSCNGNRDSDRVMGSIPRIGILGQNRNEQFRRGADKNTGTTANPELSRRRNLRSIPDEGEKRQVYSSPRGLHSGNPLDKRRETVSKTGNGLATTDKTILLDTESNSTNSNIGETHNENIRTRDDSTRNYRSNREGHQLLEGVREHQDHRIGATILRSIEAIRELGRLTIKIKQNFERIRAKFDSPKQVLKQNHTSKSQDFER